MFVLVVRIYAVLFSLVVGGLALREPPPPINLGCNGLHRPSDLASSPFPLDAALVLTWELPDGSDSSSVMVAIADERIEFEDAADRFTTHALSLRLPTHVATRLLPGATYKWRVRDGDDGQWSATSTFETAPAPAQWGGAEWIGGASQLRTDWSLPNRTIVRARGYASGLGAMDLHVNGQRVGDHIMDPGWSVYDQRVLYVSFNLTILLRPGSNAVGAVLGNSKWGYLDIFANRTLAGDQSGDATRALMLLLTVEFADGSNASLRSLVVCVRIISMELCILHLQRGHTS